LEVRRIDCLRACLLEARSKQIAHAATSFR
jgi:hypothetical protein